jgi:hypothetical protein
MPVISDKSFHYMSAGTDKLRQIDCDLARMTCRVDGWMWLGQWCTAVMLAAGTNPFMLAVHAEGFLQATPSRASQSCSHRPDRQLHGTTDFTAVLRAVPVALAYRYILQLCL